MTLRQFYDSIHGDYLDMQARFPSEALIERFVRRFAEDGSYDELMEAVRRGDIPASFEAAHKLKGVAANLAFTELYDALYALTEQLRPCTQPADRALLQKVGECYAALQRQLAALEDDGCGL